MADFRCTYRLQLGPHLGFAGARELVPYLRDLGVSHLYLSPCLRARSGSTHGYDVADPTRISDDLGGEPAFRRLCCAARDAGLGVLLDIVPNHMAASDENPFWREEALRRKFFDVDPETGRHRRFFDIDDLAGVREEDPEVFDAMQHKALSLVREGLVDGLRIDHPDGLADPAGYLERLREEGVEHVWVEKILEPGEALRDWPVEGTVGYEFANDVTQLFVDPAAEERLTRLYEELTGERRPFSEIAYEAKLEQATTTFRPEFERLRRLYDHAGLEEAAASLHVYRTYVEPLSGRVVDQDRDAVAPFPDDLRRVLLLDERGHDEFVTRFQQATGPVMAKGVEDTAFYRYFRLAALNEVGGNPGRFGLGVDEFHRGNLERARRFPRHLLLTQTHDTKRSGDVRARLVALTWIPEEWEALARELVGAGDGLEPNDTYLALQTVVGAWPLSRDRLDLYLRKALREGKRTSNWLEPDEQAERRVQDFAWNAHEDPRVVAFVERLRPLGKRIALAQTLLKLTCPGVPDVYQGDELWSLNLVDPDNRRPVGWALRRSALADPPAKLRVISSALALRARRPAAFEGSYEPIDAGPDVCAFTRGGDILVAVPLRERARFEPRGAWRDALGGLDFPVTLLER